MLCHRLASPPRALHVAAALRRRHLVSTTKNARPAKSSQHHYEVGDAPFPLKLLYTYRSPFVSLRRSKDTQQHQSDSRHARATLLGIFSLNLGVFGAWVWVPHGQDRRALREAEESYCGVLEWKPEDTALADAHGDFMTRHFTTNIENLVEGRLHTLVTAGFSHGDLGHLGGNMFALWLFGYRSCMALGPTAFLGLYIAGAFVCSSAHIMHNLYRGQTAKCLSFAEKRSIMRKALLQIDAEAQQLKSWSSKPMLRWLTLSESCNAQTNGDPLALAGLSSSQQDEPKLFERIGRRMKKTGEWVVDFVQGSGDARDGNGNEPENDANEDDGRLELLEKETAKALGRELVNYERSVAAEQRLEAMEHRRQQAMMKLAQELVFHCHVATRDTPSLGASGAIMAISNGSVLLFPSDLVVRSGINVPLPAAAAMYTLSDIAGIVYQDPVDFVDHVGHLAGAGTGLLYVLFRWTALRSSIKSLPIIELVLKRKKK